MTTPIRATYRLQLGSGFGFAEVAAVAPYLDGLGISHVYLAPVFAARAGSTHGYDVTDPTALNPELGGEAGFRAMAATLLDRGLGLVLDIVPNHMGIGGDANFRWLDVLRWGPGSRFARWFDIDWNAPHPGLAGKILLPILGKSYREALTAGAFDLRYDPAEASFAVWADGTHKLPVCPETHGTILPAAGPAPEMHAAAARLMGRPGDAATWSGLDALIAAQFWRPAKHSLASDALNYRRFFAITDLVGVRVEDPEVFDASHALVLALIDEGLVHGLRIDHIDGLRDPKAYLNRLRSHLPPNFPLLVEKILAPDEALPVDWRVDGTTGYEFANLVTGLLVDPAGADALTRAHAAFTGHTDSPVAMVLDAKREVQRTELRAELDALVARLLALPDHDVGRASLARALIETIAALDVYRTYADADGMQPPDQRRIATAIAAAQARCTDLDPDTFAFLEKALTPPHPSGDALEAVLRFQQLTGPVMAKGLEDTALYRYPRLLALNEVGGRPDRIGVTLADFHAANAGRLAATPRTMLATGTHDTKRGEDARARIAVLARHADRWHASVAAWHELLADPARPIDRNDEYAFYQLLLGAWPAEWRHEPLPVALAALAERIDAAMLKSAREAGLNTRWTFGDPGYEAALAAFVARALDPRGAFLPAFRAFEATVAEEAASLCLAQLILKLTLPGVPDIYQGAELWDQSMVDPDNRRPVDFSLRSALLAQPPNPAPIPAIAPRAKFDVTRRLLALRRSHPRLFSHGSYEALPAAAQICAYARRDEDACLVVALPLHAAASGAALTLPDPVDHAWRNVLTDEAPLGPSVPVPGPLVLVSAQVDG